ncbi:hypothetical protein PC112_g15405 [Phytophthora cactorum]|nr:hypothetical protein PC112_g15405 [Phytophthora cactorum]
MYASLEEAKRGIDSVDGYAYTLFYDYGKRGDKMDDRSVYACISHEKCEKRIRVAPSEEGSGKFCLKEEGVHTGTITNKKKRGIPWYFMQKYESVPSESQLKNRNATLRKQSSGGWEIKNVAELVEWTSAHLYCCGLIISSRAIFWSVTKARSGQNTEGVLGVTDGTYRLHFEFELGGWTIVYFGTYTTYYDKKQYAKTFVPRAYMFVRTEHQVAYATMFTTSVHRQRLHASPLCSGAVGRAKQLLDNKKNYYTLKAPKPRAVLGVLFDGTKFLISCRNINGSAPTRGRAQPYLKSLGGPTLQYSSLSFDPPNQISPRELSRKIHPVGLDPVDSR